MSLRKKLLDTFGAQVSSDHERYPADLKCLGFLYLYVGRYPRNNASRNNCNAQAGQKDKQAGMFFDRNHLSIARRAATDDLGPLGIAIDIAIRYRKSRTGSIAIANRDIDSEPVSYGNGRIVVQ
ncbi:MAG: hypothetical protein BECKG1743D_GA0114223_103954 [Candidatus Kentron sp. G]|nr:MAG: hypothetical protein BECKG1743D_GA0114223_103954 [Candidatus Kentron sp. G]